MKDINELMARIDGFEPLPVSEETLGAYLEGTLPDAVADSTADIIDAYPELQAITEDAENDANAPSSPITGHYDATGHPMTHAGAMAPSGGCGAVAPAPGIFGSIGRAAISFCGLMAPRAKKTAPTKPNTIDPYAPIDDDTFTLPKLPF